MRPLAGEDGGASEERPEQTRAARHRDDIPAIRVRLASTSPTRDGNIPDTIDGDFHVHIIGTMASGKGILLGALGGLVLRDATVRSVDDVGSSFRAVSLEGDALRGQSFSPGDKLQMLLPSRDCRTYTPITWDAQRGRTELLVYHHKDSPSGAWIRGLRKGDVCRFVGPQRSLRVPTEARRIVLFGDETSCAVALAIAAATSPPRLVCVFEATAEEATRSALGELADRAILVWRDPDDAHLDRVVESVADALGQPGAELLLTGRAQAIQAVRAGLKKRAIDARSTVRAYWSLGRVGLD